MANANIPLISKIVPADVNNNGGEFPVTEDIYQEGGLQIQPDIAGRNAIPPLRVKQGSLALVLSTGLLYEYFGANHTNTSSLWGTPSFVLSASATIQRDLINFVNSDTAVVTLGTAYADTNYAIALTCGSDVVAYYDESTKSATGFTIKISAPFTGEVSYEVIHL